MQKDCFPSTRLIICQFLAAKYSLCFDYNGIQMWGFQSSIFDVTNKCTALNFIFSFPDESKVILLASFTNSLSNDIKLVRYKKNGVIKGFDNLN